ncbi:hypothetical protein ACWD0Z_31750 [Streptomyces sp. NPDC003007]
MTGTSLRRARVLRRAGLALACGALLSLAVVLVRRGGDEDAVSMWVSVVSAIVSVGAFVADLVRGADTEEQGAAGPPEAGRRQAAGALAEAVRVQWPAEVRRLRLCDPDPLDVRWSRWSRRAPTTPRTWRP